MKLDKYLKVLQTKESIFPIDSLHTRRKPFCCNGSEDKNTTKKKKKIKPTT